MHVSQGRTPAVPPTSASVIATYVMRLLSLIRVLVTDLPSCARTSSSQDLEFHWQRPFPRASPVPGSGMVGGPCPEAAVQRGVRGADRGGRVPGVHVTPKLCRLPESRGAQRAGRGWLKVWDKHSDLHPSTCPDAAAAAKTWLRPLHPAGARPRGSFEKFP